MSTRQSDRRISEFRNSDQLPRIAVIFILVLFLAAAAVTLWLKDQTKPSTAAGETVVLLPDTVLQEPQPALQLSTRGEPVLVPPPPEINLETIHTLLPRDTIQSIDDPQFTEAAEAATFMEPDERVIGLVINGDVRAYPIPILSSHEIVNDFVGGAPVAVTWCPLCYTALVFSRQVDNSEQPLTFGVSGKLLRETLVMYDRETNSLWSQLYGASLDGPLAGSRLAFFPSTFTKWSDWQQEHPDSLVLSKPLTCAQFQCGDYSSNPRGSYHIDAYESYYAQPDEGVVNNQLPREALNGGPKKRVFGIRIGGTAQAYPYELLASETVLNDVINDTPVLIWFDPESQTGSAYLRQFDERALTFELDPSDPGVIMDLDTGSRWRASSGRAVEGSLEGSKLLPVLSTSAFEFGWYGYFPDSGTYSPSEG